MDLALLIDNLTNPALLFFILGILAVCVKSDLEIPPSSSKFISLYLLFSIGFKGGQELSHEAFSLEIMFSMFFGVAIALLIPVYSFFILRKRLSVYDSVALSAAYGSVSAVTFVTAASYLETMGLNLHGHMVAMMALMESPAIIAGLVLLFLFNKKNKTKMSIANVLKHSLTNGSVLLIIGSLIVGFMADAKQAEGIKPFTDDIFKGFLAIFLLDMGIISGRKLNSLVKKGWFPFAFAIVMPLINGITIGLLSSIVTDDISNRFIFAILAASASYIAVPAAMKITVPKANPGLYLPMALAVTFPVNITIGMPIYFTVVQLV